MSKWDNNCITFPATKSGWAGILTEDGLVCILSNMLLVQPNHMQQTLSVLLTCWCFIRSCGCEQFIHFFRGAGLFVYFPLCFHQYNTVYLLCTDNSLRVSNPEKGRKRQQNSSRDHEASRKVRSCSKIMSLKETANVNGKQLGKPCSLQLVTHLES